MKYVCSNCEREYSANDDASHAGMKCLECGGELFLAAPFEAELESALPDGSSPGVDASQIGAAQSVESGRVKKGKLGLIASVMLAVGILCIVLVQILKLVHPYNLEIPGRGLVAVSYLVVLFIELACAALLLGMASLAIGVVVRLLVRPVRRIRTVAYLLFACVFFLVGVANILGFAYSAYVYHAVARRTELTYSVDTSNGDGPQKADVQDLAEIMRHRLRATGSKWGRVMIAKEDRIIVEVPDPFVRIAKSILTRTGTLEFRLVADEKVNAAALAEAERTDTAPAGWHYYALAKKDPKNPGRVTTEKLLVSDSLEPGEGLTGENIKRVSVGRGGPAGSEIAVHVSFKDEDEFWTLTKKNVNRRLAIILDDVRDQNGKLVETGTVFSAPVIRQAILGAAEITGGFTQKEAEELKLVLQSGSLKWPLTLEGERLVQ